MRKFDLSDRKSVAQQRCNGFTLIEIVIIVVVLGILATVAIPQFGNVTGEASDSAASGLAGAAAAASANNAAACRGGLTCVTTTTDCDAGLISLPTGAAITGTYPNCTVTYKTKTATFRGYSSS